MHRKKLAANKKRVRNQLHNVKIAIAKDIAKILDERQLTQTEAAYLMQDAPSQISLVVTGKLRGFSTDRLLTMRAMLGAKVRFVVSNDTIVPDVMYYPAQN